MKNTKTLNAAEILMTQGDYFGAIKLYLEIQKKFPAMKETIDFNIRLAKKRAKQAQAEKAINSPKVLWVKNPADPMTHEYRIYNYAKELTHHNIDFEVVLEEEFSDTNLSQFNIVIFCRSNIHASDHEKIDDFKGNGGKVIFDIDDLIFSPEDVLSIRHLETRGIEYKHALLQKSRRLRRTLMYCDYATASTFFLKKEIEKLGIPAFVIVNTLGSNVAANAASATARSANHKDGRVRLGYFSGTRTHNADFAECSGSILRILKEKSNVELLVMGHLDGLDEFAAFGDRFIRVGRMDYAKMLEYLSTVDINIAPLGYKNLFTQGKSELKIFEAALYHIPTIASPTASYSAVINHSVNGLLARNENDWYLHIEMLVENNALRIEMGKNASESIADRFRVSNTIHEWKSLITAISRGAARGLPPKSFIPLVGYDTFAIGVLSVLYNNQNEVYGFLETMRRQSFDRKYEIVLVDDCSSDESADMVSKFISDRMPLLDTNRLMSIRLLRNDDHLGSCISRNIAFSGTKAELVVSADVECLYGDHFLATHFDAYQKGECDLAFGPQGIETGLRPPFSLLEQYQPAPGDSVDDASYRNADDHGCFVNCSSRNFSVSRQFVNNHLEGQLFNEAFNCAENLDGEIGYDEIDLGCRINYAGGRILHLVDALSIHVSKTASPLNLVNPQDSLKRYRLLHEKHPNLLMNSEQWSLNTFAAITASCRAAGQDLEQNEDYRFLRKRFSPAAQ